MKNLRGFTLVELMITMVILAILLSWAVPSFNNIIRENRVTTETNQLITAINLARSEAVRRSVQINVVPVSADWNNGWTVKINSGADLRVFEAPKGTISVTSSLTSLEYSATGLPVNETNYTKVGDADITLNVCDSGDFGRQIRIVTGRPRIDGKTPC